MQPSISDQIEISNLRSVVTKHVANKCGKFCDNPEQSLFFLHHDSESTHKHGYQQPLPSQKCA